ncbi:DUF6600 domain-containing protein [Rhodanobacter ginsengiterrae]|uniref:DUF6600 domain-containing protein n=1 Tax=Rhodanobacter ginsengiterrae TaxID=2008451 RepID=UPI003CF43ED6
MSRFAESSVSWRRGWRVPVLLLLCLVAGLAQAQADTDDSADPPTRVARLSYVGGDLGFLPSGAKDWSDANVNRPLTSGDKLSSADGARAELEFDGGTLRIDGRTDLGLLDLNDQLAQIELTQGSLSLTVRHLDDGESYEIDTPAVALVVDQPGTFRVDVDPRDGSTRVAALDGAATVFGENNAQRSINPGRSYRFGDASLSMVTINDLGGGDAFDRWASERDDRYAQSTSRQYVSEDVVGYQDLDQYGGWQDSSEYGAVWYPRGVDAGWAPYRNGHWAYIAPWGWSWIDDAPWGYAPYHYGRWAYTPRGWGWIPGPRGARAIYAPALVAFVGGGGWSVGIGGAPVGWFPLGPGEIYNPWYRCGRRYYTNVNVYNIRVHGGHDPRRDIDEHYNRYRRGDFDRGDNHADHHASRGFTAVSGASFAAGGRVQRDRLHVDPRKLGDAPMRPRDIASVRPIGQGERTARTSHVRNLPAGGFDRAVVARRAPPGIRDAVSGRGNAAGDNAPERVRVLGRDDTPRHPPMDGRDLGGVRRPVTTNEQLPVVPRITPVGRDRRADFAGDNGEVRSARFAHPRGSNDSDRRGNMPRPGVSYIAPSQPTPSANPSYARPLPQNRDDNPRPAPYDRARFQREDQPAAARPPTRNVAEPRFERPQPQPRFQRAEPSPRQYMQETPRPMPTRNEPAPPRYQPPPRPAPPPRMEAPRQQQSAPRPSPGKAAERRDREDRQH